jgi:uncharacterized membrane-anchored protein YjiN (DUF445 family)
MMANTDQLPEGLRPTPDDELRRARLVAMQRVATALLVVAAAAYAAALRWEPQYPWLAWVRAFSEAAMVGGVADWFAVTALFRHPLGLPIPHTAIIPARKARIGAALGNFVQRFFLAPEVVAAKLEALRPAHRLGSWLADPANARRVAAQAAGVLHGGAALLRDDDVQQLVDRGIVTRLRRAPAAPLAARALELVTAGGRHHALLDDALRLAARLLTENDALIRDRIRAESPWWVPGKVEEKLGDRVVTAVERTLAAVAADPAHPLRQRYDEAVARFVTSLREDPATMARAEALKGELLDHPAVAAFAHDVWQDAKGRLAAYAERVGAHTAEDPDALERWLAEAGARLAADPVLAARVDAVVGRLGVALVGQARGEVAALIASTVASWDAEATSRKIELQVGRDLQFIRINGTLVGGLVGLLLHALRAGG